MEHLSRERTGTKVKGSERHISINVVPIEGTIMRYGYFDKGKQVGVWTTYDKQGKVYKVTKMKNKDSK